MSIVPRYPSTLLAAALALSCSACGSDDGGPPTELPPTSVFTTTGNRPAFPVASNGTVFWSEAGETPVMSRPASGGAATQIAYRMQTPLGLALHGSDVVWVDGQYRVSPGGCVNPTAWRTIHRTTPTGATTLLGVGDDCSQATSDVVVAGEWAWWVSSTSVFRAHLQRSPLAGGTTTTAATATFPIASIASDGSHVYWLENFFPDRSSAIRRIALADGAITTLVSGFASRTDGIAVNGQSLFFTVAGFPDGDSLMAVPVAGGMPVLLGVAARAPRQLLADAARLYWSDDISISSIPLGGGAIEVLAPSSVRPFAMALRDADIIWSDWQPSLPGASGTIRSVPKTGGSVTTLIEATEAPRQLIADANNIWFSQGSKESPGGMGRVARLPAAGGAAYPVTAGIVADSPPIAVASTDIFIADSFAIFHAPRGGGLLQPVAGLQSPAYSLVTDGAWVYWMDAALRIYRAPAAGGAPALLAQPPQVDRVGRLALAEGMLYWNLGADGIVAMPTSGGTPTLVATTSATPVDLLADDVGIYYSAGPQVTMLRRVTGDQVWSVNVVAEAPYAMLARDETRVFGLTPSGLAQMRKSDGRREPLTDSGPGGLSLPGITAEAGVVYWTDPGNRRILSVTALSP